MTLNERFVGGNPLVLLLLFCLFCVILICFVGICSNIMRKSEKKFDVIDQKHWHGCASPCLPKTTKTRSEGTTRACGGTAVPTHQHTKTKKFYPHSNNPTSFIFKLPSLNLHNFLQTSPNHTIYKTKATLNFIPNPTHPSKTTIVNHNQQINKFVYPFTNFFTNLHTNTRKSYLKLKPIIKTTFPTQNLTKTKRSPKPHQFKLGQLLQREKVENLFYVGTNPQVQEDHGDDSDDEDEEGAQLHDNPVHDEPIISH